jgi:hypothetical protein
MSLQPWQTRGHYATSTLLLWLVNSVEGHKGRQNEAVVVSCRTMYKKNTAAASASCTGPNRRPGSAK